MGKSYWSTILRSRIGRRRALTTASSLTAGGVLLVACASDGSSESKKGSELFATAEDTSKAAKRGGTIFVRRTADVAHFDPYVPLGNAGVSAASVFSRLFRQKPGYLEPASAEYIGDLAESWEMSPDKLQLTVKLKNTSWHNIPPLNSRRVDSEDVVASWTRFERVSTNRGNYSAKVNPSAPIDSIRAIDATTVALKLSQPVSSLFGLLATSAAGMYFTPREADGGYDPRVKAIGSGPWAIGDYAPSVHVEYKRHDGHYEAGRTYLDSYREILLPEYAAALSQFRAGNIFAAGVRQEDVLGLKKEVPAMELFIEDPVQIHASFKFGWNPALGPKTPFRDRRLRQAFALSIDRDLYIDAIYDVPKLKAEGIPIETYLYTACYGFAAGDYWLDPKSRDFGPNAKFFAYDAAEAKKLVSAAGFPNGLDTVMVYGNFGNEVITRLTTIVHDFINQIGIRARLETLPYAQPEFQNGYYINQGDFEGFAVNPRQAGGIFDPVEVAFIEYTPSAAVAYTGFFSENSTWKNGDPEMTALLTKARQEFDDKKRISLMHEFQRLDAATQYRPATPGVADSLALNWPALRNYNVFRGELPYVGRWLDASRPPLGSA